MLGRLSNDMKEDLKSKCFSSVSWPSSDCSEPEKVLLLKSIHFKVLDKMIKFGRENP